VTAREVQITFDCGDPRASSLFWCDVLGHDLPPSTATAAPPARTRRGAARLFFQGVPEGNEFCLD